MSNFDLTEAKRSGFYLGGGKGSGKTKTAQQFADDLIKDGITVYVFDNSQAWQSGSSIPEYVTIDKLPFILDFPPDKSLIFDISLLYVEDQRNAVANICKVLFTKQSRMPKEKRKWIFLIFEEAQIYLQQGSMRSKSTAEIMRLITVGRNYCIGFGLITQYPSTVDKLPIKAIRQRYFGYTDERNDKEYIESFLGKELVNKLSSLKTGEFMLNLGGVTKQIQFPLFTTSVNPIKCDYYKPVTAVKSNADKEFSFGNLNIFWKIGIAILILMFMIYVYTHTTTRSVHSIVVPLINFLLH